MNAVNIIDHYQIGKTLGTGIYSKVKLVQDTNTGVKYAMKIMERENPHLDAKFFELVKNEVGIIENLSHPHIVKVHGWSDSSVLTKPDGRQVPIFYIVLELVTQGELFEYICSTGRLTEDMARFYFKQLLEVFQYIHAQGICHRDLKAENLLMDGDFNLKLADFGFSAPLGGKDGSGYLTTYLGTPTYMAPEINLKQAYNGVMVDLFALGVLLFIMTSALPPFKKAHPEDQIYRLLCTNRNAYFWKFHSKSKPGGEAFYSPELKSLLNSMLSFDATQRLSIAEIKSHPWILGPCPDPQFVFQSFAERKSKMEKEAAAQAAAQAAQIQPGNVFVGHNVYRSVEEALAELGYDDKQRLLYKFEAELGKPSNLFSTYKPQILLGMIARYMSVISNNIKVSDTKYKVEFNTTGKISNLHGKVTLSEAGEGICCVEFSRKKGDILEYNKLIKEMWEEMPDLNNAILTPSSGSSNNKPEEMKSPEVLTQQCRVSKID